MRYRTLWVARHRLPDDRLVHAAVELDGGAEADIHLAVRKGRINPVLARAMAEFSHAFAQAGVFQVDPEQPGKPPELQVWFEGIEERYLGNLPMNVHYGGAGSKFFTILVDEDLVEPALLREMNEEAMPEVCRYLVPTPEE